MVWNESEDCVAHGLLTRIMQILSVSALLVKTWQAAFFILQLIPTTGKDLLDFASWVSVRANLFPGRQLTVSGSLSPGVEDRGDLDPFARLSLGCPSIYLALLSLLWRVACPVRAAVPFLPLGWFLASITGRRHVSR